MRGVRLTTEEFIERCKEVHGDLYCYCKSRYTRMHDKVEIICVDHGVFLQTPDNHINKRSGCPSCYHEIHQTWTLKNWTNKASHSPNFKAFKLYLIECSSDKEKFYKIGRTFNRLNRRLSSIPYNTKILATYKSDPETIIRIEQEIISQNRDHLYSPLKSFYGTGECFTSISCSIPDLPEFNTTTLKLTA